MVSDSQLPASSSVNAESATVVLFGGTGFIGTHLAQEWLRTGQAKKIVLVDLLPPRNEPYCAGLQQGLADGRVAFVPWDVRQPIPVSRLPEADLIFNLAAIHREPGHASHEYFETNLLGAENVCAWASSVGCSRIVFTSSIAPYGPSEDLKNESSLPVPETPYGRSKLAAEKIHIGWQSGSPRRRVLLLRPGVVFGPGEGGNVTRLVRSVVKGYFVYMGNRQTRKAGGYVKELDRAIRFGMQYQDRTGEAVTLLNFSMDPPATLESYVNAIRKVAGVRRHPISVPRSLLLGLAYPIDAVARAFGIHQPVSPVRVRKLFRSTSIDPAGLRQLGYVWQYSLEDAFLDWKHDRPEDFAGSTARAGN
ncbi:MAG TPA: NAD(P)-dependent oxidoreductase [Acidobacteriaceae bacterium]|nr:NAD(P)-dependent oxidoreductase [Acidobacteriaceae bacterium]